MAYLRDRRAFGNIGTRKFRGARFGDALSPRFSGLLDQYVGAAAAYSLRTLSASWLNKDVVEVRRASDNTSEGFTEKEITNGTLVDWVNEEIELPLDTASGAAAAYSLRNLSSSYTGNVVEVRRSSDGNTESFTAAEVTDGTLQAWVNTDVDKLDLQPGSLDAFITNETATGFDFSVNSEGSNNFKNLLPSVTTPAGNYTVTLDVALNSGNLTGCILYHTDGSGVVTPLTTGANSLNLTSDAAEGIFFYILGTAVADVSITNITLTQTTADGHVSTWYDQSGNDNHATQGTPASQPKIVDAGALVVGGLDFDGTNHLLGMTLSAFGTSGRAIFVACSPDVSGSGSAVTLNASVTTGASYSVTAEIATRCSTTTWVSSTPATGLSLISSLYTSGNIHAGLSMFLDGSSVTRTSGTDGTINTTGGMAYIGSASLTAEAKYNGRIEEIIIYPSDQSDKRRAIESNIASHYSITLPTGSNPGSVDAFVTTWYDQSGNANNATQATTTAQPKIVSAGALVVGGLDFDGVDDYLFNSLAISYNGGLSWFSVQKMSNVTDDLRIWSDDITGVQGNSVFYVNGKYQLNDNGTGYAEINATGLTINTEQLASFTFDDSSGAYSYGFNAATTSGTLAVWTGPISPSGATNLGIMSAGNGGQYSDGTIQELIIYPDDQSANRVAIEANINAEYSIYA